MPQPVPHSTRTSVPGPAVGEDDKDFEIKYGLEVEFEGDQLVHDVFQGPLFFILRPLTLILRIAFFPRKVELLFIFLVTFNIIFPATAKFN